MRSLFFNLCFYIFTLLWATLLLVTLPLPGRKALSKGIWIWSCIVLWMLRAIVGVRVDIRGRENLESVQGGFLLVSKHMSDLDPIVSFYLLPDMTALAKKELFRIPVIGLLLRKLEIVRIDRQSGKAHQEMPRVVDSIRKGGRPLVVYPEGTRAYPGERRKLKSGAFYLQEPGDLPAIPMATNSGLHWPKGSLKMRPGTVIYEIGAPFPHEKEKARFMALVETRIIERSETLMKDDPQYAERQAD